MIIVLAVRRWRQHCKQSRLLWSIEQVFVFTTRRAFLQFTSPLPKLIPHFPLMIDERQATIAHSRANIEVKLTMLEQQPICEASVLQLWDIAVKIADLRVQMVLQIHAIKAIQRAADERIDQVLQRRQIVVEDDVLLKIKFKLRSR